MQTYEILVRGRAVQANSADTTLVRTSVGIDKVHVLFDNEEWLDFALTVTFAQGSGESESKVTSSITPSLLDGGEWVAEAECLIPWEVIDMTGPIRITFQGFDSDGNHIITAAGSPLSVEEAGDVDEGKLPQEAPTIDQWNQAYADAMAAASKALNAATAAAGAITALQEASRPPATTSTLGEVIVDGETITVDEDGTIHGSVEYELPIADTGRLGGVMVDGESIAADQNGTISLSEDLSSALANLRILASKAFDTTFDGNGMLEEASVKADSLPLATDISAGIVIPDGDTITANGGVLTVEPWIFRTSSETNADNPDKNTPSYVKGFSLLPNTLVSVVFNNGNTSTGKLSLNVGGTGSREIIVGRNTTSSTNPLIWDAGETLTFFFDGQYYILVARAMSAGVPKASTSVYGTVMPDGASIGVNEIGKLYVKTSNSISASSGGLYVNIGNVAHELTSRDERFSGNIVGSGLKKNETLDKLDVNVDDRSIGINKSNELYVKSAPSGGGVLYGTCGTHPYLKAKAVECDGFELSEGAVVAVGFEYGNTYSPITLDVNGTGAKGVKAYGSTATTFNLVRGAVVMFRYDGSAYEALSTAPIATASTPGLVSPGRGLEVASNGVLDSTVQPLVHDGEDRIPPSTYLGTKVYGPSDGGPASSIRLVARDSSASEGSDPLAAADVALPAAMCRDDYAVLRADGSATLFRKSIHISISGEDGWAEAVSELQNYYDKSNQDVTADEQAVLEIVNSYDGNTYRSVDECKESSANVAVDIYHTPDSEVVLAETPFTWPGLGSPDADRVNVRAYYEEGIATNDLAATSYCMSEDDQSFMTAWLGTKADGTSITLGDDGVLHGASNYELPPATADSLGGVKPDGVTITVDEGGAISASRAGLYGTSSTYAFSAVKYVSAPGFELVPGAILSVKFAYEQEEKTQLSLNVNGTGEKPVWRSGAVTSEDNPVIWAANNVLTFVYDGYAYQVISADKSSYAASSRYTPVQMGTCSTASYVATKVVECSGFSLSKGAMVAVTFKDSCSSREVKLNVNKTGAVNAYFASSPGVPSWDAGVTVLFIYDGEYFLCVSMDYKPVASPGRLGMVRPDGVTVNVDPNGILSAAVPESSAVTTTDNSPYAWTGAYLGTEINIVDSGSEGATSIEVTAGDQSNSETVRVTLPERLSDYDAVYLFPSGRARYVRNGGRIYVSGDDGWDESRADLQRYYDVTGSYTDKTVTDQDVYEYLRDYGYTSAESVADLKSESASSPVYYVFDTDHGPYAEGTFSWGGFGTVDMSADYASVAASTPHGLEDGLPSECASYFADEKASGFMTQWLATKVDGTTIKQDRSGRLFVDAAAVKAAIDELEG